MRTKDPFWANSLQNPFIFSIFMVEESFIWTNLCKNQDDLIIFLKILDVSHGQCPLALNKIGRSKGALKLLSNAPFLTTEAPLD